MFVTRRRDRHPSPAVSTRRHDTRKSQPSRDESSHNFATKPVHRSSLGETPTRGVDKSAPRRALPALSPSEIDRKLIDNITGGDAKQLNLYAQLFETEVTRTLHEMRDDADGGDLKGVLHALHGLRGAAATIGAIGVRKTVSRLEEEARSSGLKNVRRGAAEIEHACRLFVEALRSAARDATR